MDSSTMAWMLARSAAESLPIIDIGRLRYESDLQTSVSAPVTDVTPRLQSLHTLVLVNGFDYLRHGW